MNDTGTILIFIGIFLFGGLLGFAIYHISLGKKRTGVKQKELDETKAELEQYKEKVNHHFMNSAELMQQVATSYQALHNHMATQSESLLSEKGISPYPLLEADLASAQEKTMLEETESVQGNETTQENGASTSQSEEATAPQDDAAKEASVSNAKNAADNKEAETTIDETLAREDVPPTVERPKDYVDNTTDAAVEGKVKSAPKNEEAASQAEKTDKK